MAIKTEVRQETLNPVEVLKKIDKEKSPKLYTATETLIKAQELADNYKIRAEKAEKEAKKATQKPQEKETPTKPKGEDTPTNLSQEDLLSLVEVHKDDRNEVVDYAKFKNISVEEALKADMIKTTLREKAGERKTALATNTGGGKRGSSRVSGEDLLKKAEETGEMPESDTDLSKMLDADLDKKQKEAKHE